MSSLNDLTNSKVTINQLVIKHLYYRYNMFLAPVSVILVCIALFLFVVIPQIQGWFALRDTLVVNAQDLQIMHQNLSTITNLDTAQLDEGLSVATRALPAEKDFAGIVTSLQKAAAAAGTSLGDYSFSVGNLSGTTNASAQLPIQLNITLHGNITTAQYFVAAIQRQLPLADVLSLEVNNGSSITVTVVFYYAALPKITFQDNRLLPVLSKSAQDLLRSLSVNSLSILVLPPASPSALPTVTPTPIVLPTAAPATASAVGTSSAK